MAATKVKLRKRLSDTSDQTVEPVKERADICVKQWNVVQLANPIKPREGRTNEHVLTFLGFDQSGEGSVYSLKAAFDRWEQWAGFTNGIVVEDKGSSVSVFLYEPAHSFLMIDDQGNPLLFEVDKKELR